MGIDVSKASLEIVLLFNDQEVSASQTVPNSEEGFDTLLSWIEKQTNRIPEETPE
jgi:hypothetical protein